MYTYQATIKNIIDGDTVEIDLDLGFNVVLSKLKIRMEGIDTPESRTTNQEEKIRGLLSKKKLQDKLPINKTVKIITTKSESDDKFGRILGTFILEDGTNVNKWMVENNYAVKYDGQNKKLVIEAHETNRKILVQRGEI